VDDALQLRARALTLYRAMPRRCRAALTHAWVASEPWTEPFPDDDAGEGDGDRDGSVGPRTRLMIAASEELAFWAGTPDALMAARDALPLASETLDETVIVSGLLAYAEDVLDEAAWVVAGRPGA
jgi:hypothetical protein